jgi:transcriptional regulator with XRE-family HTH domain
MLAITTKGDRTKVAKEKTPPRPELIHLLKTRMDELNWTPYELSSKSGTAHPTVYDTINGKNNPGPETLRKWAKALGVSETTMMIAAGRLSKREADEVDLMVSDVGVQLRRIRPSLRAQAMAVIRGALSSFATKSDD